jgi:hypothetical protein
MNLTEQLLTALKKHGATTWRRRRSRSASQ